VKRTLALISLLLTAALSAADRPNLLLLTVDDMSCDSMGAYGCQVEAITPHMDKLASESLRFEHAHVVVGNCYPSRNVMWSGRYPHTTGVEGFYKIDNKFPVLCDLMKGGGYWAGIQGKVSHSTPYSPYDWDADLKLAPGEYEGSEIKDAGAFHLATQRGIQRAKAAGKPFCINVNVSDPHKPFYTGGPNNLPSRIYTADEITVPGFLPDTPVVRAELAEYYSSVRRGDDCVGQILEALEDEGVADTTVVVFLSDHGMPFPFAKTALYHHSSRTPLMVRWPGKVKPGTHDVDHMVSTVDLLPTLLDVTGIEHPEGLEGRTFLPLLKGEQQDGRDFVIKEYNENSGCVRNPIRAIQTKQFLYLYNPWANGELKFKTATQGMRTYKEMIRLAETDEAMAARLELFDHRVIEELYDVSKDPDCLVNLAAAPEQAPELEKLRATMLEWMRTTEDHALAAFEALDDPQVGFVYVAEKQAEATARRGAKRKKGGSKKPKGKAPKKDA